MSPSKVLHLTVRIIVFSALLTLLCPSLHATEYYAFRLSGSDCKLCHTDPQNGSLNQTGTLFQEDGYRYPLTLMEVVCYLLGCLTLFFIIARLYRRYRLWHMGKDERLWDRWKERCKSLFWYGFAHRNILRSLFPGMSHLLLYGSLLILGLAVSAVLFQEYLTLPLLRARLFDSKTYPYLRLTLDFFGTTGWLGTILLGCRRYLQRPRALDNKSTDAISLFLLFSVFSTGLLLTGARNQFSHSLWSQWAPVASTFASFLTPWLQEGDDLKALFSFLWWSHLLLSLGLLLYFPVSRLLHGFASPLNIFFRNLGAKGALSKLDLESETFGVERMEEFTWKHLLELDACTRCGRCQENCPAFLTEKHLNPKRVVQNLNHHMERPSKEREALHLVGEVVTEDEIWECTTCRNCLEHCPVFIEPMIKLIEFRRNLVLQHGKVPRETHFAFRNIERKGNPWGFDPMKRMWWAKEKGVKEVSPGEEVDLLYWVGCYSSYDDRNIRVADSLIRILNQAGVDYGVLGSTEWCCGIDLRRMGSEYLFQLTVERNIAQLLQVKFKRILTACPHCFNTLKNEYPQFGATFEVIHYSTLLDQLIRDGKITLNSREKSRKITFHDSCYLGRYNDGYEPPRRILEAIPDLTLLEMERSREKGFCCGGGGCHMWMEERAGRRINQTRIEEARKTGAEIIGTVCPLCLISLDSAVKVLDLDRKIQVMDVLELVGERLRN